MDKPDPDIGFTRLRIGALQRRSRELYERGQEFARPDSLRGSSPEQVRLAAERADQSRVNAAISRQHMSAAYLRSAAAHDTAADCYERLAAGGYGDVEEHRRRAGAHREKSVADRTAGTAGTAGQALPDFSARVQPDGGPGPGD